MALNQGSWVDDTIVLSSITAPVITQRTGWSLPFTLTVTNGVYSIGDSVGGVLTLPNVVSAVGKHCRINTVTLGGVSALEYNLWFLSADIATTAANNATFTIVEADELLFRGSVNIPIANYVAAQSSFNVATVRNVGLVVQAAAASTSLYAYLIAPATTTPATTTLYLRISGEMLD